MLNSLKSSSRLKSILLAFVIFAFLYLFVVFGLYSKQDVQEKVCDLGIEFVQAIESTAPSENNTSINTTVCTTSSRHGKKLVGFLMMATGKYSRFIEQNLKSFRDYVFVNSSTHDYRIIYFTDEKNITDDGEDAAYVYQRRLRWPFDSSNRFDVYVKNKFLMLGFDYIIALDIDIIWIRPVTPEYLLNDFIVGHHINFPIIGTGSFESNQKESAAYMGAPEYYKCVYVYGGFYGGTFENFFEAIRVIRIWKESDLLKNIQPTAHDESYLNKYVCLNFKYGQPNLRVLPHEFLRKEFGNLTDPGTKVFHVDKKHRVLRYED